MPITNYKVTLLLTFDSGEDELRTFRVEARNADEAVEIAKQQAMQDEHVVEAQSQMVE